MRHRTGAWRCGLGMPALGDSACGLGGIRRLLPSDSEAQSRDGTRGIRLVAMLAQT